MVRNISLQRRVLCEPNADEGARDRARLASGLENALGVRRSSMYCALSRPQRLPWQTREDRDGPHRPSASLRGFREDVPEEPFLIGNELDHLCDHISFGFSRPSWQNSFCFTSRAIGASDRTVFGSGPGFRRLWHALRRSSRAGERGDPVCGERRGDHPDLAVEAIGLHLAAQEAEENGLNRGAFSVCLTPIHHPVRALAIRVGP
jgi:hypothetical protein